MTRQMGGDDVVEHRQFVKDTFRRSVVRHEDDAHRRIVGSRSEWQRLSAECGRPRHVFEQPCQRADDCVGARTNLTGNAQDASPRHNKRDVRHDIGNRQAFDLERGSVAGLRALRRIHVLERPSQHQLDQLVACHAGDRPGRDVFAVSQDRHAVANIEHLAQPMGDVDHRAAARLQRPQCGEQALNLDVGECGSRLIENEDSCVTNEPPRDLDDLALTHGEIGGRPVEVGRRGAERLQHRSGFGLEFRFAVEQRHPAVAQPDIVEHRQVRREAQFLGDDGKPQHLGHLRRSDLANVAIDRD